MAGFRIVLGTRFEPLATLIGWTCAVLQVEVVG
jgi:hypothetical protein